MIEFSKDDIDFETAKRAYNWISFSPEKRAESEQESYVKIMTSACETALKIAISDEQKAKAKEMLEYFKTKLIILFNNYLGALSRCASAGIAGPANFNYSRNEKAMNSSDNRLKELNSFIEYFHKKIANEIEKLKPEDIKVSEIKKRITKEVNELAYHVLNKSYSLFKTNSRDRIETLAKNNVNMIDFLISEIRRVEQEKNIKLFTDKNKIWDFFKSLQTKKETSQENKSELYGDIELVYNYEQDRLQLLYPSKPNYETIGKLKKNGWRWSSSNSCWQRQLTPNAIYNAKNIILS